MRCGVANLLRHVGFHKVSDFGTCRIRDFRIRDAQAVFDTSYLINITSHFNLILFLYFCRALVLITQVRSHEDIIFFFWGGGRRKEEFGNGCRAGSIRSVIPKLLRLWPLASKLASESKTPSNPSFFSKCI